MYILPAGPKEEGAELFTIFMNNPFPFLERCFKEYGDMFTIKLGNFGVDKYNVSGNWVFLCNDEYIQKVFKSKAKQVAAAPANDIQFQGMMPERSILLLDNEDYIERRGLMRPSIQSKVKIRQLTLDIEAIAKKEMSAICMGQLVELAPILRSVAAKVMSALIFGDFEAESAEKLNENITNFGSAVDYPEQSKAMNDACRNAQSLVSKYKSCPQHNRGPDNRLFDVLMAENAKSGGLTESEVSGDTALLLLGGNDTTATTMNWAAAWILSQPEVLKKVMDELNFAFDGRDFDFDKLEYLDAVIKESIRISPMLFTTSNRLLLEPLQLGDYVLPVGTIVATCPYIVHNREDYYLEPSEFKPERFMEAAPDPYRWLHFGGGVRRCLGMEFALYEIKVVLATLLRNYRFEPVDVNTECEKQGLFFSPKGSVVVKITMAE